MSTCGQKSTGGDIVPSQLTDAVQTVVERVFYEAPRNGFDTQLTGLRATRPVYLCMTVEPGVVCAIDFKNTYTNTCVKWEATSQSLTSGDAPSAVKLFAAQMENVRLIMDAFPGMISYVRIPTSSSLGASIDFQKRPNEWNACVTGSAPFSGVAYGKQVAYAGGSSWLGTTRLALSRRPPLVFALDDIGHVVAVGDLSFASHTEFVNLVGVYERVWDKLGSYGCEHASLAKPHAETRHDASMLPTPSTTAHGYLGEWTCITARGTPFQGRTVSQVSKAARALTDEKVVDEQSKAAVLRVDTTHVGSVIDGSPLAVSGGDVPRKVAPPSVAPSDNDMSAVPIVLLLSFAAYVVLGRRGEGE